MDDTQYGTHNKRGDFTPNEPLALAPIWAFPLRPLAVLKWLPGYFLPWNPLWTASAFVLWTWANDIGPWVSLMDNGWYLLAVWILLRVPHETHFFPIHRLIHTPFLYKHVHSVHHNSVNPSPWSSLSMHPVEHLLYFARAAFHFLLPSHPLLAIYQLNFAGFGAVVSHIGFDKIEVTKERGVDSHAFAHYLHHKDFEVNHGDGLVPLDKLFGTWHDGSKAGEVRMNERYQRRKAKLNAKAAY